MNVAEAIEASDVTAALSAFDERLAQGEDTWEIHRRLFPVVQAVQNPPFINPHLPKMYAICREFVPKILWDEDLAALVRLEVSEYARRPKLEIGPPPPLPERRVAFRNIETSLQRADRGETAALMAAYCLQNGAAEFARRMLLLGSGYLDDSLGHSISCTSFILLEMMERSEMDSWPVLAALAEYFHKGGFSSTPPLGTAPVPTGEMEDHLLLATSGIGIINLHHTITIYTIDRVRHLLSSEEYNHLVRSWITFLGDKKLEQVPEPSPVDLPSDYPAFREAFERLDPKFMTAVVAAMLKSPTGRSRLFRFLIKAVCDLYRGDYNPHNITGLGSLFWVFERFSERPHIILNATFQYLHYFFAEMRR